MADGSDTRWMPTVGGVIDIISGILGLIGSFFLGFIAIVISRTLSSGIISDFPELGNVPAALFWFLAILMLILSIITLIGGIFAVQRRSWAMALAGSICAIFHGTMLGVIATIFIAMSRKEFRS